MSIVPEQISVALLAGGTSGERAISLESGKGASAALREAGFSVTELDPANKEDLVALITGDFDVAFLCLHGKGGEDGAMQGMLEVIGLPYTCPGVWSSATAMDKEKAKVFYRQNDIPTPISIAVSKGQEYDAARLLEQVGQRVVVKPAAEGSALGVSICETAQEIEDALASTFEIASTVMVETFVAGRELTVAVIGNDNPEVLPVIEILPQLGEFYDYESKYAPGGSKHLCPAPFDADVTARAQRLALEAHKALKCRGVSRTDMILDENNALWVLETNTIPGMTETSLLPDAGRAAGISFPELCTKLVEYALED